MGFLSGLLTGAATSIDNQLKADMKRTEERMDGMELSIVDCLCGVCFDYCDEELGCSIGLIAQDVEPVLPRVVSQGDISDENREEMGKYGINDGMYGINYGGFVPVLIEAVKELKQQVETLKDEIEILKGNG